MTRRLHCLWPGSEDVVDPTPSDVGSVVVGMPPNGRFVILRPDEPERAEHYLQVERSGTDAEFWGVEIRHGDADHHLVTRVGDADTVTAIARDWLRDERVTPPAERWWSFHGGNVLANRTYRLRAYVAGPDVPPLWRYDRWQRLAPTVTPLLATGRGRTSVQSLQTATPATGGRSKPVSFGPMSWTDASHRRWTHVEGTDRVFVLVEVSAPGWRRAYRQGIAPDVLLRVAAGRGADAGRFSVLVATATDLRHAALPDVHRALVELVEPVLVADKQRPWGLTSPRSRGYSQPLDAFDLVGSVTATSVGELKEEQTPRDAPPLDRWHQVDPTSDPQP